jgi:hypothetical protein
MHYRHRILKLMATAIVVVGTPAFAQQAGMMHGAQVQEQVQHHMVRMEEMMRQMTDMGRRSQQMQNEMKQQMGPVQADHMSSAHMAMPLMADHMNIMTTHMRGLIEQMQGMMKDPQMMQGGMQQDMNGMHRHMTAMSKDMGNMIRTLEGMHKGMRPSAPDPRTR